MQDNEIARRRTYRSPLREAAARRTRSAVLEAARAVFVERGYGGATLAAVAEAAGVSVATVKLVGGSKAALLLEVTHALARGDAGDQPLLERAEWQEVIGAPTGDAVIAAWTELSSRIHERQAAILLVMGEAAATDPEAAAFARHGAESRHADVARMIEELDRRGALRPGLDHAAAVDIAWAVDSPDLFRLFQRRGWTRERWRDWVREALAAQLISD